MQPQGDKPDNRPVVCVFGANDAMPGEEPYELARAVGRTLASLGYTVANGGYRGTMEASARGAKEANGATIGVTCSVWSSKANSHIDRVIQTDDLFQRVRTLIELGDGGYVVLGGGTGTLVELAMVWELRSKGLATPRPIVCMGGFWRPLVEMMARQKRECSDMVSMVMSPSELSRHFKAVQE